MVSSLDELMNPLIQDAERFADIVEGETLMLMV